MPSASAKLGTDLLVSLRFFHLTGLHEGFLIQTSHCVIFSSKSTGCACKVLYPDTCLSRLSSTVPLHFRTKYFCVSTL